jgi:hypothetical protein
MTIGKEYLNKKTRQNLIDIATRDAPEEKHLKTKKWVSDEPILNTYFLDKISWLPKKYNMVISEIKNTDLNEKNNYQYTGPQKPWNSDIKTEQFSEFIISNISKNNKPYMVNVILTKLIKFVKNEIKFLKEKNIDVRNYYTK